MKVLAKILFYFIFMTLIFICCISLEKGIMNMIGWIIVSWVIMMCLTYIYRIFHVFDSSESTVVIQKSGINNEATPNQKRYNDHGADIIDYELDERIHTAICRRKELKKECYSLKLQLLKDKVFSKNSDSSISDEYKRIENLKKQFRFKINEDVTAEYTALANLLSEHHDFSGSRYTVSVPFSKLFSVQNHSKGDIGWFSYKIAPIQISTYNNIFCFTPYHIIQFSKGGKYQVVYHTTAVKTRITSHSWKEKVPHQTYRYTRVDGQRDRRYKNNPQITYYTETTRTASGLFGIELPGFSAKYSFLKQSEASMVNIFDNYAATKFVKEYDSVYHLLRLLDLCEPQDVNILELQKNINIGENN